MFKKIMVTVIAAGLALGSINAKSIGEVVRFPRLKKSNVRKLSLLGKDIDSLRGMERLAKKYPNLEELDLRSNRIRTIDSEAFAELPKLKVLKLSRNWLSEIKPNAFAGMSNLKELDLSFNYLFTLPEGAFAGLVGLEELDLKANRLRDLPKDFSQLEKLGILQLQLNWFGTLPRSIDHLPKLWALHVAQVPLRDGEIERLEKLRPKLHVYQIDMESIRHVRVLKIRAKKLQDEAFLTGLRSNIPAGTAPKKETCSICLGDKGLDYMTSCGHFFHAQELNTWFKEEGPICPVCKQNIFTDTPAKQEDI